MFSRISKSLLVSLSVVFLLSVSQLFARAPAIDSHSHAFPLSAGPAIEVYFNNPGHEDRCGQAVVDALALTNSGSTVRVQAFSFTSEKIADALIEAHKRGVDVQVILDKKQNTRRKSAVLLLKSKPNDLVKAEIPTFLDPRSEAHNKAVVINESLTITGSFNFSEQAETKNAENLLIIRCPAIAKRYSDNWKAERKGCKPAKQNNPPPAPPPPPPKGN